MYASLEFIPFLIQFPNGALGGMFWFGGTVYSYKNLNSIHWFLNPSLSKYGYLMSKYKRSYFLYIYIYIFMKLVLFCFIV